MSLPQSAYIHKTQLTDNDGFQSENVNKVAVYYWDSIGLAWVKGTQASGGGGGGAVTIADGADVAQGSTADAAIIGDIAGTLSAKLRGINATLQKIPGLALPIYDYVLQTQSATQDVWVFKTGGGAGTTVATVTINYTDSTKAVITNVAKT
jgi:hypothetical protein